MGHSKEQVAWNNLKLLRRKFDKLMSKYGGEVPRTIAKLKKYTKELNEMVEEHTRAAGFVPSVKYVPPERREEDDRRDRPKVFKREEEDGKERKSEVAGTKESEDSNKGVYDIDGLLVDSGD